MSAIASGIGNESFWTRKFRIPQGEHNVSLEQILAFADLNPVLHFDADPLGSVDSTEAFQTALDAAIYTNPVSGARRLGRTVQLPSGQFRITTTLVISNVSQLKIEGNTAGTVLVWDGPADRPMFRVTNGSRCHFKNFSIYASVAKPLLAGIDQLTNSSDPGYLLPGSQVCYENLTITGAATGLTSNSVNFHWLRGAMSACAECFFVDGHSDGIYSINGLDCEGCGRLLNSGVASVSRQEMDISNVRFETSALHADGRVIIHTKTGSLVVRTCFFGAVGGTPNVKIDVISNHTIRQRFAFNDNTIYTNDATPWVNREPTFASNNVQFRNGAASVMQNRQASPANQMYGTVVGNGGFKAVAVPPPITMSKAYTGVAGVTTWGYKVTTVTETGESLPSAEVTVTLCAATLDVSNFITLVLLSTYVVPGAKAFRIYRTTAGTSPATLGLIGEISAATVDAPTGGFLQLIDNGLAATTVPPTVDTSADATFITARANAFMSNVGGFTSPWNIGGTVDAAYLPSGFYTPPVANGGKTCRMYAGANFIGVVTQQSGNWAISDAGQGRFASVRVANNAGVGVLQERADNAAAIAAGVQQGEFYKTGDLVKVVHP